MMATISECGGKYDIGLEINKVTNLIPTKIKLELYLYTVFSLPLDSTDQK